jgi:hypothetical protein
MESWLMNEQESSIAGYLRYYINKKYATHEYTSSLLRNKPKYACLVRSEQLAKVCPVCGELLRRQEPTYISIIRYAMSKNSNA